jgi:NitT/TauT family transport system substrate-binding protein
VRQVGLTANDIDLVNVAFPDTLAAFKSGAVDAAYVPEPFASQASRAGVAGVFGTGVPSSFYTVGLVYSGRFMRERPEAAMSTMQALVRAARDLRGDGFRRPENLAVLAAHTHLPPEAFASLGSFDLEPNLSPDADTLRDMQQVYMDLGVLNYREPLPLDRLMDASFSAQAAAALAQP